MISIYGIEYQKEIEGLPFFNKNQASLLIGKKGKNLDKKLEQLKRIGYLLKLKNNWYVSDPYYQLKEKNGYTEYIANTLRFPSYVSLEYVLAKEGLIPEGTFSITSITSKSTRTYRNFLGTFIYKHIKEALFTGYRDDEWELKRIKRATRAKALFDFLYLKKLSNNKQDLMVDLRINWEHFHRNDYLEFITYVKLAQSKKMSSIANMLEKFYSK